jgi:hypothetical protein
VCFLGMTDHIMVSGLDLEECISMPHIQKRLRYTPSHMMLDEICDIDRSFSNLIAASRASFLQVIVSDINTALAS